MGLSLLSLMVLAGLYWGFAALDVFEKNRVWTCRNYNFVCKNIRTSSDVVLNANEIERWKAGGKKLPLEKKKKGVE